MILAFITATRLLLLSGDGYFHSAAQLAPSACFSGNNHKKMLNHKDELHKGLGYGFDEAS